MIVAKSCFVLIILKSKVCKSWRRSLILSSTNTICYAVRDVFSFGRGGKSYNSEGGTIDLVQQKEWKDTHTITIKHNLFDFGVTGLETFPKTLLFCSFPSILNLNDKLHINIEVASTTPAGAMGPPQNWLHNCLIGPKILVHNICHS